MTSNTLGAGPCCLISKSSHDLLPSFFLVEESRPAAMRAFVVANDLVVYATAIAQPTGIQRVGKGALEGLLNVTKESAGTISIEPITVSNGKARLVSPSSLGIGGSTRRSAWFAQPLLHLLAHAP